MRLTFIFSFAFGFGRFFGHEPFFGQSRCSSPRAGIVSASCRECGVERRPSPCSRVWTHERVGSFQTLNRARYRQRRGSAL